MTSFNYDFKGKFIHIETIQVYLFPEATYRQRLRKILCSDAC